MKLRKGITGFRHVDDPPLPTIDLRSFRSHCFAAARMLGGRVSHLAPKSGGVGANFTWAVLELPAGTVAVLVNLHFPVVGIAHPWGDARPDGPVRFIDCEPLACVFEEMGRYEVVSQTELERSTRPEERRQLSPTEVKQVKYWKPTRVGDIVFNSWD